MTEIRVIPTSPEAMAHIRYAQEAMQEAVNIAQQFEESAARIRKALISGAKHVAEAGDSPMTLVIAAEYVAEVAAGEAATASGYAATRAAVLVRRANEAAKTARGYAAQAAK